MGAVENGWVPDRLTRMGIRRLLDSRLREIQSQQDGFSLSTFIRATKAQPIAVQPELANDQHYEVPSEFFQLVLGQRLKYSCCYWSDDTQSLDDAEINALQRTCRNAELEDGMDILELGCGWGSLSLWMAEKYPNSCITAVSNSHSQRRFIEARAQERNLTNLTIVTSDMNQFATELQFDRVVSVEMFEHMRNHHRLMNHISHWLRPDGKMLVHVFCHKQFPYLFHTDGEHNWMGRHFFSGGMMPSIDLLPNCNSRLTVTDQYQWNGSHYAKTCRAWLENQDSQKSDVLQSLSSTYGDAAKIWINRWRMFFMACEELFAFNSGEEWFVMQYLFQQNHES